MKASPKEYFVYYIYIFFKFLFTVLPKSFVKYILIFCAKVIFKFDKEHKHIAKVNLDLAYKDSISDEQKNIIIYESYKSLLFNMYEFIENQSISKEKLLSKAKLENEEVILNAIKNNRKIIFFSAHYGGWELAIPFIALKFGTVAIVNREMNNPLINDMYKKVRNNNNIIMIDKKTAAKGVIKALKQDQFVTVVIDQHIKGGEEIEFFDQKVKATDSTSRLALKFDAVLIPIFCVMNDFRDYTIKMEKAIDVSSYEFKTDNKIKELTQLQNTIIENQIKQKPELWFWQHRRFKYKHNEFYKRNK